MTDEDEHWKPEDYNLFVPAAGVNRNEVRRNGKIAFRVKRFLRTGDMETLAQLAELDPPGGSAEVGQAIAKAVRQKENDRIARDHRDFEIDRLFRFMTEQGTTKVEAYTTITEIYFPDEERKDTKPVDSVRRQHERWVKRMNVQNKERLDKEIKKLKEQSDPSIKKSR